MRHVPFSKVKLTDGFWSGKTKLVEDVTNKAVYDWFAKTGRFDALDFNYRGKGERPHIFWDSDIAKWIESVAYCLHKKRDPGTEEIVDGIVDQIASHQGEDGYYNLHFGSVEPEARLTDRTRHELYCAGHLMEAAVAYCEATGKDKLLKVMCKYADFIDETFRVKGTPPFCTPGHEEIELALVRLYDATGNEKYLHLSKHFIDKRGKNYEQRVSGNKFYAQDHLPVRQQTEPEGHAVRAMYLYASMADIADRFDDGELKHACGMIFDNTVNKKMYITGGLGSTHRGEAFTTGYYLPNATAYAETCAAIAFVQFASRMQKIEMDSKYADACERAIYNGVMSGISLDGRKFFYENPLEIARDLHTVNTACNDSEHLPIMERIEYFGCSCCPPNLTRFIASIARYIYSVEGDTIYVHQYIASEADDGVIISMKEDYIKSGRVSIESDARTVACRIPWFSPAFRCNCAYTEKAGYIYIENTGHIELEFDVEPKFYEANPLVRDDAGKVALMKGPIVYCMESKDNPAMLWDIAVDISATITNGFEQELNLPTLHTTGTVRDFGDGLYRLAGSPKKQVGLQFVPYFAFANRGKDDMIVWVLGGRS